MPTNTIPHPPIVSRDQWLDERKKLLAHEKELTKHRDRINAERRRLPMVKIEKDYVFDGPNGKQGLKALFDGRRQLIVYHFMFDPKWDNGCPGCTSYVSALGDLSLLNDRDTTFVLVSRAPLPKLEAYKAQKGWSVPWFSSFGSDFNYDFHVTNDEKVAPIEYNYRNKAELEARNGPNAMEGKSTASAFSSSSTTMCSTPTRSMRVAPKHSRTPATSLTRHPMGASRTLRTHPPVGHRGRPTASPREVCNEKGLKPT